MKDLQKDQPGDSEGTESRDRVQKSKIWLQAVLENKLIAVTVLKSVRNDNGQIVDFEYIFVNKKAEELIKKSDLAGKYYFKEFPGQLPSAIFRNLAEVAESGNPWEEEIHFKYGELDFWAAVKASRLEDGCLIMYSDITLQKMAEKELLRLIRDRYLSLFNNIDQGFCITQLIFDENNKAINYRFLEVNPAFEKITGIKDAVCKTVLDFIANPPETWFFNYSEVSRTGSSIRFETEVSGSWFDVLAFQIGRPEDHWVAMLVNEITSQKKAEEFYKSKIENEIKERTAELNESRNFIKRVTDTMPDVLFVIDLIKKDIVYVSKGIYYTLGFEPEKIYKREKDMFKNLIPEEDYFKLATQTINLLRLKPEEIREISFRIKDVNGKIHWMDVRYTIFNTLENGNIQQVLGVAQDITKKKETELAFKDERLRNAELIRLNELMNIFVHAAAHDLKAPISNLMQLTDLIDDTRDENLRLQLQKKYRPIINILNSTISGLISVLTIEMESSDCVKQIMFHEVYEMVANELADEFSAVRPLINLDFYSCPSVVYVETYLFSIFRNLLGNALKYRSPHRDLVIDITSEYFGDFVLLTIRDNGIGIDLERYKDDLFKPFKRYSQHSEGSGLGLHLVKSIVTKNGGKIEIESSEGTGSEFKIYLNQYVIKEQT